MAFKQVVMGCHSNPKKITLILGLSTEGREENSDQEEQLDEEGATLEILGGKF